MIRRVLAVVVSLLTLNVSAAEALRVCANQSDHVAPAQAEHADHQHEHGAPAQESPDDPAPSPLNCCEAMTSCGISIAVDAAAGLSSVDLFTEHAVTGTTRAPSALQRSPEPPPPKE